MQHQERRQFLPLQRQFKGPKPGAVPAAIPPITQSASEVTDAQRMQQVANQKRKGLNSTLLTDPTQQQQNGIAVQTSNLLG